MRQLTRYRVTVAALVVILTLVVFLNDLGHFNTDIKPEVYLAPWETLGRALSGWTSSPFLGSPNFNVGLAPVLLVVSALRGIGLTPELAFKALHLMLWLLGAAGASRLARTVAPHIGKWGGLLAGVVFIANPYTVQAGATLAVALPMVLLPWQLWCLVRALAVPSGWAWPAAFGLTFFAMSGMNVAVVPLFQLLATIPVALAASAWWGLHWSQVVGVLAKCALFVVGLSVYWLIPAVAAQSTGTQIAVASETLTGIAKVSSLPEVLRGVGLWPLYGHSDDGPWIPEHAVYLISPFVIVLGILWPVLALLALRWCPRAVRLGLVGCIALAAVVMVGIFPGEADPSSPFGSGLRTLLQQPAAVAFRTTNKIGAVLALAFAIAIGVGGSEWLRRYSRRPGIAALAPGVVVVLVVGWVLPPMLGGLYTSRMDIPDYWKHAAAASDEGSPSATALLLPGQVRPEYRWTVERPDDLTNALFTRDAVLPLTTPNASPPGANLLAALDAEVQSGGAPDTYVSTMARYFGSDRVLLRHDLNWGSAGGARPATTSAMLRQDTGLTDRERFGWPGEFVLSPDGSSPDYGEDELQPVELYTVRGARDALRAQSLRGQVVVAGDGFAFAPMTRSGALENSPTVQYAHDLGAKDFASTLSTAGRYVITDTNARREVIANRLTAGQGPLLSADQPLNQTRTLGADPDDHTVLKRSGAKVSASTSGGAFFDLPFGTPDFAADGDPDTAWRFGDFGRAVGQKLTITLPEPTRIDRIPVSQLETTAARINKVTVSAGGKKDTVRLPDSEVAHADLAGVTTGKIVLRVDSIRGSGFNHVGIAEVGLPDGTLAERTARTPVTLTNHYRELTAAQRSAFAGVPLDVLLSRVQNTPGSGDDSETELRREISLPDRRTYTPTADIRVDGSVERLLDDVVGYDRSVRATSSDHYFRLRSARASQAADGRSETAWIPANPVRGEWWQITGEQRDLASVSITQQPAEGEPRATASRATQVHILVDGKRVTTEPIGWGKNTIRLPSKVKGKAVRVEVAAAVNPGDTPPPRFSTIDAGVEMTRANAPDPKAACQTVATVDGTPLRMRPAGQSVADADVAGTPWVACEEDLALTRGAHRIEPVDGFVVDHLTLRDRVVARGVGLAPRAEIEQDESSAKRMEVSASSTPYAVVIGQSVDPRWRATADGEDLGPPRTIDGFSAGWVMPPGKAATIEITYGPQRWANVALAVSLAVLIGTVVLVARRLPAVLRRGSMTLPSSEPVLGRRRPPGRAVAVGFVAASGIALSVAGVIGALISLGLVASLRRAAWPLLVAGSALIFVSIPVYLFALGERVGEVSADAVSLSMWPHWIASAGLVMALAGAVLRTTPGRRAPTHPQPAEEQGDA